MKILSIRQYAEKIGKSKPAVMNMIREDRLPAGVKYEKVDNFYIIILKEK